jgi:hypothetical protein
MASKLFFAISNDFFVLEAFYLHIFLMEENFSNDKLNQDGDIFLEKKSEQLGKTGET